jgi:hypothetical protein
MGRKLAADSVEGLQSHDDLSEAVPKATCADQCGEPHTFGFRVERVSHARAERRWDSKICIVPVQNGWMMSIICLAISGYGSTYE